MAISLNHTIVPTYDNVASARFYEEVFGFEFVKEWGHFAVLKVSPSLTFDFMNQKDFNWHHYAFKVSDQEFDTIFARINEKRLDYGSGPRSLRNGKINHDHGGRGVYFEDPNGHILEILTADYDINEEL